LRGVDSYVGEFAGEGVKLTFDFGIYSSSFDQAKKPAYVISHESIGGLSAKVVHPRTAGHGITGVYFRHAGHSNKLGPFGYSNKLSLFAEDLTSTQQELVLKIFETVRFQKR
jgi:hypothetical protein